RVSDEAASDRLREQEDSDGDYAHHRDREPHRLPATLLGLLGIPRTQVLPDEGRSGNGEAETRHEGEALDSQANLMGRQNLGTEDEHHADPEQERDLEEDLLKGRGPADWEDS